VAAFDTALARWVAATGVDSLFDVIDNAFALLLGPTIDDTSAGANARAG